MATEVSLISKKMDWITIGGLSIILLPIFFLIPSSERFIEPLTPVLYTLAFLVNYPHFTISYQLLYGDYRKHLFKDLKYLWAGIIVPLLMVAYLAFALSTPGTDYLVYFVQFMFVIVGWHYTKQTYGVVMVTAAQKNYYFTSFEKLVLRTNMYGLWLTSFISFNVGAFDQPAYWGIEYTSLNFPKESLYIAYGVTAFTLIIGTITMLVRINREKKWPPIISIIGFVTIYAWFLPLFHNPLYFLAIPFFHSIQYFTFVYALKKGEADDVKTSSFEAKKLVFIYLGFSILTGAFLFEISPRILDVAIHYDQDIYGQGLFLFIFSVFINIHHYFIDNVIWRRDNKEVSHYLFHSKN